MSPTTYLFGAGITAAVAALCGQIVLALIVFFVGKIIINKIVSLVKKLRALTVWMKQLNHLHKAL